MSYETYTKLIESNAKFADSISEVGGRLQINAEKAFATANALQISKGQKRKLEPLQNKPNLIKMQMILET
jgi:hypothetical protein